MEREGDEGAESKLRSPGVHCGAEYEIGECENEGITQIVGKRKQREPDEDNKGVDDRDGRGNAPADDDAPDEHPEVEQ